MAQFAVLITHREIVGREPKLDELRSILSKYPLSEVLFLLAKLNCLLDTWQNTPNFEEDRKLTRVFLPNDFHTVEAMHSDARRLLFSRLTLLYLMKQVCCVCPELGADPHTPAAYADFGLAALMANDLLLPFVPSSSDGTLERLANILPFSDYIPHDEYGIEIGRSQRLFDEISQLPLLTSRLDFIDVKSLFSSSMGFSHSRFSQLVFGCSTKFLTVKLADLFQPEAMVVRTSFFQKSTIPTQTAEHFFQKTAIPIKILAQKVNSSNRPTNDFTLFQQFPMVEIANGIYTCLDPGFLVEKAGRGLFWTLFSETPEKQKHSLASFWGAIFETYVNSIVQQSYKAGGTFVPEPKFPNGDQAFDACLVEAGNLITFEHKSSTLRADSKYSGDVAKLKADLDLKFVEGDDESAKGVAQLRKSISRFLNGEDLAGLSSKQIHTVYPVLVCLDNSVSVPYMGRYFSEQFRITFPRHQFKQSVTPVFTLAISDVENLLPYLHSFRLCDIFDSFYKENRSMLTSISRSKVPILKDVTCGPNVIKDGFSEFGKKMEKELFPVESASPSPP